MLLVASEAASRDGQWASIGHGNHGGRAKLVGATLLGGSARKPPFFGTANICEPRFDAALGCIVGERITHTADYATVGEPPVGQEPTSSSLCRNDREPHKCSSSSQVFAGAR